LPPPDLRLSVAVADGLDDATAQEIATNYVESPERRCRGYATLEAACFFNEALSVIRDDVPFFRHANVLGWPNEKPRQKAIAQRLAENAKLHSFAQR
jgi:hypothetical protein